MLRPGSAPTEPRPIEGMCGNCEQVISDVGAGLVFVLHAPDPAARRIDAIEAEARIWLAGARS